MTGSPWRYEVFGEGLTSAIAFPELREVTHGGARWHFDLVERLSPMDVSVESGDDLIYGDVHARLYAHAAGHRITVDDTGAYDLSADLRTIRFTSRPGAWPDFVRAHFLGRVLSTALWFEGCLPLHASAVATADGALAFLAPKGFGKSSIALALVEQGARLVTDDTLAIEIGAAPRARPGVHSVRVHDDAMHAVGARSATRETREGKLLVTDLPPERLQRTPTPLRAIYLLAPMPPETAHPERVLLPPTVAAVSVVAHVKIGRMLGAGAAGAMLQRAASVSHQVPVYRLQVARALERLPDTAAALLSWHGGAP